MCRAGGRRCEHNWSEAQHQADLARRRAIYAQKTQGNTSATHDSVVIDSQVSTCVTDMQTAQQECNFSYDDEKSFKAYKEHTVTGQINPEALTNESYKEFGFEDPDRWGAFEGDYEKTKQALALSKIELRGLTVKQMTSLSVFTTNSFRVLNRYLHDSPRAATFEAEEAEGKEWDALTPLAEVQASYDTAGDYTSDSDYGTAMNYAENLHINQYNLTASRLNSYVDTVDEAFSKVDGRQRVVYRGEKFSPDRNRFAGHNDLESYVDSTYTVGQQVSFKGMQSTSIDESQAQGYGHATAGGIIYEISTPSGIAVAAVSPYAEENEVLLPRNSRYQIVGKSYTTHKKMKYAVINLVEVDEDNNIRHAGNLRKKGEFGEFDASKYANK